MSATVTPQKQKIAIADDNLSYLVQKSQIVQMAGFEPLQLRGQYHAIQDLLDEVRNGKAEALVCDHKLSEGNYANFDGVEVVAALYNSHTPALLVTDYVDSDLDSIRRYRRKVPVLIRGGSFTQSAIKKGLKDWQEEVINHNIPLHRRARRAVIMIDDIIEGPKGRTLTIFVPRWREHEAISISEDIIPQNLRKDLKKGNVLTASINTDTELREDLFFEDFRLVPDEDEKHETA